MNNLFALLQGKDNEIVDLSGSRALERDQATDEETKVQANAHNQNDSVFALILNAMGTKAAEVSDKIEKAGVHKQPEGTEMLKFFKYPFAVYCSQEYLSLLRETLSSQLSKVLQGGAEITAIQLKNTLNLLAIQQANIDCMVTIRIKLKSFLSEEERKKMRDLQAQLDQVELE